MNEQTLLLPHSLAEAQLTSQLAIEVFMTC